MISARQYIIIHHSLTEDSKTVSWQAIRRHHKDPNGRYKMRDIGYHFGIEMVNDEPEILVGRSLMWVHAAHCVEMGMNQRGIGICVVGNYDLVEPSPLLWIKLKELIHPLMDIFNIPTKNILGHREVGMMAGFDFRKGQYKTCPGRMFDMDRLRVEIDAERTVK